MALVPGTLPWVPGGEGSGGVCAGEGHLGSQNREARVSAVGGKQEPLSCPGVPFSPPAVHSEQIVQA